jgi:uncharacterized protein (DUF2384 family)
MTRGAEISTESSPEDRACVVVRMALHAFGDAVRAADWLAQPNDAFGGYSPLFLAKQSVTGCARVCQVLDSFVLDR